MIEWLENAWIYIYELGLSHSVNPIIFGVLYIGSIPPYLWSIGWLISSLKNHKPLSIPILTTLFFFILPSLYIVLFGKDVAWWVYGIILILLSYGGFTAYRTVQSKLTELH